jgi:hypothetical protein
MVFWGDSGTIERGGWMRVLEGKISDRIRLRPFSTLVISVSLFLLIAPGLTLATETPVRLEINPQEIRLPKTIWYGAYLEGKKVGYAKVSLGRKEHSGRPCYSLEQTLVMKIASMGQKNLITSTEVFQFDTNPPYLLSYARRSDGNGLREETVEMARTQNGFAVILKSGTETETRQLPQIDLTLADGLATEQWFKRNPDIGESITTRILDIRNVRPGTQTIKVLSSKSVTIDGARMRYYEASLSFSTTEGSEILKVDQQGNTLFVTLGGGLELRLEPEELARSVGKGDGSN